MARGTNAKNLVTNKIAMAFGSDYVGESGGKIYVWADDGSEKVQIAIALTCPKTFIEATAPVSKDDGWDFSDEPTTTAPAEEKTVEITEEEKNNIEEMMKRLGL